MRKNLTKIKISLLRSVEKLKSRKRHFCLFVCLGVFISEIELPKIPLIFVKDDIPSRVMRERTIYPYI